MRNDFYGDIVLAGGTTMFPGIGDRLKKDISGLNTKKYEVKVVTPPERRFSVWIGGSIVASFNSFRKHWITRQEYQEHGVQMLYRKRRFAALMKV